MAIDSTIRPLVTALNRAGYKTTDSCQGGGKGEFECGEHFPNAYISFNHSDVPKSALKHVREIVKRYTSTPFKIWNGYYFGSGLDPNAGMWSIIFKGEYIPK